MNIRQIGAASEHLYGFRGYFKGSEMACRWASLVPFATETSLSLISKAKVAAVPFSTIGFFASSCKFYTFLNRIRKNKFKDSKQFYNRAVLDTLPFMKRGCQLAQWGGRLELISISMQTAFRLSLASTFLSLLFASHKLSKASNLNHLFKQSSLVLISLLSLSAHYYQSDVSAFSILALKTFLTGLLFLK